jgi:hypothetical protein
MTLHLKVHRLLIFSFSFFHHFIIFIFHPIYPPIPTILHASNLFVENMATYFDPIVAQIAVKMLQRATEPDAFARDFGQAAHLCSSKMPSLFHDQPVKTVPAVAQSVALPGRRRILAHQLAGRLVTMLEMRDYARFIRAARLIGGYFKKEFTLPSE